MNLLVPQTLNPDSISAEAKKLRDANHPNAKRLKRSIAGLTDELQESPISSDGRPFLDISRFRRLIPPRQLETSMPDVHMTNCALLAIVMFSKNAESSQPQVMQDLDALFPLCFMEKIAQNNTSRAIGASHTQDTTFSLALNIRTQFFIVELERRQREPDFNPIAVLRQVFCMDLTPEDNLHENPGTFRGFRLPGVFEDEDGHLPETLPEKLQLAVSDRFNDLYEEISEWDEIDVDGLRKVHRWRSFERDLARWIHTRSREVKEDIRRVSDRLAQNSPPSRRFTPASVRTPVRPQTSTESPLRNYQTPRKQHLGNTPQGVNQATAINSHLPVPSPQKPASLQNTASAQKMVSPQKAAAPEKAASPESTASSERAASPERAASLERAASPEKAPAQVSTGQAKQAVVNDPARRKSKSNYRDVSSFFRLKQRMNISRQQQSLSGPTSNPPNGSSATATANQRNNTDGPAQSFASDSREILESPDLGDLGDDDFTYVNNEDEVDLDHGHGGDVMASTSPSASARINRVSHNPGRYVSDHRSPQRTIGRNHGTGNDSFAQRRLFIHKQNDAGRVSPINDDDSQSAEKPRARPSRPNAKKRQIPDTSSDESDEFEQDEREASRRPEKRQRVQRPAQETSSGGESRASLESTRPADPGPSKPRRVIRATQSRADSEDLTDGETSTNVREAGTNRRIQAVFQPRSTPADDQYWAKVRAEAIRPGVRKPTSRWSEEEDQRLHQLMSMFGTSYATIKKHDSAVPVSSGGPCLEGRSQVQCKDRARTIKKKLLRDNQPIPEYLKNILP
ncbi:unnamed protein product [Penicillium salamii]|nr:unnamed protein product [Penicillium salamii]CAG8429435.1 unnamed protein product [Penicillium salamii]